ncbi:Eco47II family restriction endonuclease [Leclercia adecarboxylata]|uniref:Eco47II family restriction endonuclease n=1 Tax=Leclercia adecarboxylata TaxID=83655 RepID=UPI0021F10BA6|nr:Eco47II family restriction endonuclease [Leclercia adecarboxylata]UYM57732.1 Eco47II family restriction endonuclease [Leclercia adecarboxylata]
MSQSSTSDLFRNTLDCFSCVIDASVRGISIEEWLEIERGRQIQKTLQNQIGEMHQRIIGTLPGITDLGVGGVLDIRSDYLRFVAEIKNKHNTTKGNHKIAIYDDLERYLLHCPQDYVGYYVEILPVNGRRYNEPFTPSDNNSGQRRLSNNRIRRIDGATFYGLITGEPSAIRTLYNMFPAIISELLYEITGSNHNAARLGRDNFDMIFDRIFN